MVNLDGFFTKFDIYFNFYFCFDINSKWWKIQHGENYIISGICCHDHHRRVVGVEAKRKLWYRFFHQNIGLDITHPRYFRVNGVTENYSIGRNYEYTYRILRKMKLPSGFWPCVKTNKKNCPNCKNWRKCQATPVRRIWSQLR